MTTTTNPKARTLYEQDYVLWLETTVARLKSGQLSALDIENLTEELEGMVRSDKRAIKSLLTVLLVHLLKLEYWETERARNANHWCEEITTFRDRIQDLLADSPSLKPYVNEVFEKSYDSARERVARAMGVKIEFLPETPIATFEQILDNNWFPIAINEDDF